MEKGDTVQSLDDPGKIGEVLRVPDYGSDEQTAFVAWNTGDKELIDSSQVRIIDRSFSHGDIVVNSSDPLGQSGYVLRLERSVDVRLTSSEEVVKNIPTTDLRRVSAFMEGDYVLRDHWIGRVDDVAENVTVTFKDGAECKVLRADPEMLAPVMPEKVSPHGYSDRYYPGLRVRALEPSVYRSARWIKGRVKTWRFHAEATVTRVDVSSVIVDWFRIGLGDDGDPPSESQSPQNLVHLPHFSYVNWELGDPCLIARSSSSSRMNSSDAENTELEQLQDSSSTCRKKTRRSTSLRDRKKSRKSVQDELEAALIVETRTFVDVVWQDGSRSTGLPSTSLQESGLFRWDEFWPEIYVMEKPQEIGDWRYQRSGVVKEVDTKQRTAKVKWLKELESPEEPREFESTEIVSTFEISDHPDFSYRLGDIVVRLSPSGKFLPLANTSSDDDETEEAGKALSWVGTVVGYEDGDIEVDWANGVVSKVGPQALYVVHRADEEEESDSGDESDAASWETVDSEDELMRQQVQGHQTPQEKNFGPSDSTGGLLSLFSRLASRLVSAMLGVGAKTLDVGEPREEPQQPESGSSEAPVIQQEEQEEEEEETAPESVVPVVPEDISSSFKHFEAVKDATDHMLLDVKDQQNHRKWLKRVHQEWSILQSSLPDSIYVRIYEDRIDLLRAVIVGAAGTPYHDGLFMFDFHLPAEYPDKPPAVLYRSGGLRLNPNLYAGGKICLSLLNTWKGSSSEMWDPKTSNLLQVLLSIQGLVLNEKPYFNEADFDRYTGTNIGERNSVEYNESTFILSCKSMLYLLRVPPMHFKDLVHAHFRSRAVKILTACKAYLRGVPVGCFDQEAAVEESSEAPAGFKLLLRKMIPKLVTAFKEIGATDLDEFLPLGDDDTTTAE